MNQIQQKAFLLLQEFIRICNKLDLTYFLVCGSALGAVKYSGFIPWDDDIDVALFRNEYEVFCREAPKMLQPHIFLQNYRTDPYFPAIYSKLRDSDTTCIEKSVAKLPMNHGICIDIFPLDGYPSDPREQQRLERRKFLYVHLLTIPCTRPEPWKERIICPFRLVYRARNSAKVADRYTGLITRWPVQSSKLIANHGNWQGKREYHGKTVYGKGIMLSFEGLPVRVPSDFESYLTQKYGDYHHDPPLEQQRSHHIYLHLDALRPYTYYLDRA